MHLMQYLTDVVNTRKPSNTCNNLFIDENLLEIINDGWPVSANKYKSSLLSLLLYNVSLMNCRQLSVLCLFQ